MVCIFLFKQKTAYEMRISDWSSDVCSSDLFAQQTAATEALRGRVGDIDQYNVKGTTNVNFDTGKAVLSEQAKADLCSAASQAEAMDNALLLVVGYTDSTGSQELNQELSEKRSEEHTSELQSLMRISYAVFCLKKKNRTQTQRNRNTQLAEPLELRPLTAPECKSRTP